MRRCRGDGSGPSPGTPGRRGHKRGDRCTHHWHRRGAADGSNGHSASNHAARSPGRTMRRRACTWPTGHRSRLGPSVDRLPPGLPWYRARAIVSEPTTAVSQRSGGLGAISSPRWLGQRGVRGARILPSHSVRSAQYRSARRTAFGARGAANAAKAFVRPLVIHWETRVLCMNDAEAARRRSIEGIHTRLMEDKIGALERARAGDPQAAYVEDWSRWFFRKFCAAMVRAGNPGSIPIWMGVSGGYGAKAPPLGERPRWRGWLCGAPGTGDYIVATTDGVFLAVPVGSERRRYVRSTRPDLIDTSGLHGVTDSHGALMPWADLVRALESIAALNGVDLG